MLRRCAVCLLYGRKPRVMAMLVLVAVVVLVIFIVQLQEIGRRPDRECCLCPEAARIVFHPDTKDRSLRQPQATVVGREFAKTMSRDPGPHIFMVIAPGTWVTDYHVCSVESAALHHPGHNVHLLLLGERSKDTLYMDATRLTHLSHIINVRLWHIKTADIFIGSPLQHLYYKEFLRNPYSGDGTHVMDAVKVLLLWMFGGIILDPDFVVLKTIDDDKFTNAIVEDGKDFPTIHFLRFQKNSSFLSTWMKEFQDNYNAYDAHDAGIVVLMRSIRSVCNISALNEVDVSGCQLTVLKSRYFFPVHQKEANDIFKRGRDMTLIVKNSFAVWLWSDKVHVRISDLDFSFYRKLMRDHCPTINLNGGRYVYRRGLHGEM
ncbi:lactosylceramide 4-alpha-galactosyltransferase-like [Ornithodoros turicata]|uniref:lactosylceramide 4-alpha-galactosyltransferase-like n=1 Tax=Ornithodoros turicata TaxID=34597 RepID=UPI003139EA1F